MDQVLPWVRIPKILCVFWPNDPEVHELIWDYHATEKFLEPLALLLMLNFGKFVTAEANDYRIAQLVAYRGEDEIMADMVVTQAARGLALSHPIKALPSLIKAGLDRTNPRAEVLITLAG